MSNNDPQSGVPFSASGQKGDRPGHRASRRRRQTSSHQRSWMWGRHAVTETLAAQRWPVRELYGVPELQNQWRSDSGYLDIQRLAAHWGVTIQWTTADRLTQLCGSSEHQGLLARMGEFPCGDLPAWHDFLNARLQDFHRPPPSGQQPMNTDPSSKDHRTPIFVICDRIQDAHNFGAILRSCDGIQADAVVIEMREQAGISPHVARSSAGAVNALKIFQVDEMAQVIQSLKQHHVKVAAASEKAEEPFWNTQLSGPVALVIGSEAFGIRPEILQQCDVRLKIPMFGQVTSLNAAVAAGILLYEIRRQQRHAGNTGSIERIPAESMEQSDVAGR